MTLEGVLPGYYAQQGLPVHGGQEGWLDWATVYGIPVPIPNPGARKRVLPYHDAHHLVAGYDTDWRGEAEVSAWAYGTQGKSTWLALAADGMGCTLGVLTPIRASRAFLRGRGCRSLYQMDRKVLLTSTLEELRSATGVDEEHQLDARDLLAYLVFFLGPMLLAPLLFLPLFVLGTLTE